ncbi:MAG: subclass B3 metallo-beta-lactamase [Gemmatimonadetes bacterium]|nr:subclass B3 metallo-beta-lactamase [Gemmatimonadota bacterium]
MRRGVAARVALALVATAARLNAQHADTLPLERDRHPCPACAEWNAPQAPLVLFGNTYWVGPHGLGSVLVTSPRGHVLIDGGLPESAPEIARRIVQLGFRLQDVKAIALSHVHYDHAGGIAALQRLTGAEVVASAPAAAVLRRGTSGPDDPQVGILPPIAPVRRVRVLEDRAVLTVGPLALTMHATPGHTPGGTSWSWLACEGVICRGVVYADSQTPVSDDAFRFTRSRTYPAALQDFERGLARLESLKCDILLTPHPDASGLWQRVARRDAGEPDALSEPNACATFVAAARERIAQRVAREQAEDGRR